MSEMIERVARALIETQIRTANELFKISDPRRVRAEEQIIASVETGWRMNEKDARAAIEAMREPTLEMVLAGLNCDAWADNEGNAVEMLSGTFTAMIDAALKEQTK